jgi:hypothetical protein
LANSRIQKLSNYSNLVTKYNPEFFIFLGAVAVCLIACFMVIARDPNSLLYYQDGISHLMIARRVFDSLTPGIEQLGSVWLPMTHIMLIPLVANNFLFYSGLAGTIVSTIATSITAVVLFRIVKLEFKSTKAGLLCSVLYLTNSSVIYMAIVPMMEALFMMFFLLSVYYVQKWYYDYLKDKGDTWKQYRTLVTCTIFISAATLTRYEGWVLPIGLIILLLTILLILKKEIWKTRIKAILLLGGLYSFTGIVIWILWNLTIFRDPLYFATSQYSAQIQAISRPFREHLYLQPLNSLAVIFDVAKDMYGILLLFVSVLGIVTYLITKRKALSFSVLLLVMLILPTLTDFAAMIQGSGEIAPYPNGEGWFNGRYLIFMAPFFAFTSICFVMFFVVRRKKKLIVLATLFVISAYAIAIVNQPLEVGKATVLKDRGILPYDSASLIRLKTGEALGQLYTEGYIVMFVPSGAKDSIMFSSGLPLKNFIGVTNGDYWEVSENTPWRYGNYLIVKKSIETYDSDIRDLLKYWQRNKSELAHHFDVIYENRDYEILKRSNPN